MKPNSIRATAVHKSDAGTTDNTRLPQKRESLAGSRLSPESEVETATGRPNGAPGETQCIAILYHQRGQWLNLRYKVTLFRALARGKPTYHLYTTSVSQTSVPFGNFAPLCFSNSLCTRITDKR